MSSHNSDPGSIDTMLEALSDEYRRHLLFDLSDHGPGDEDGFTLDSFVSRRYDDPAVATAETMLFHAHLPSLADRGYIEWDPADGTIRRGPNFDEIASLLEVLADHRGELPADLF